MTKVIVGKDCGNSPKNIFLQNLTIAFAKRHSTYILGNVTDDIIWNIVGNTFVRGKDDFAEALERRKNDAAMELTIYHVATHGKSGFVNGTTRLKNGKIKTFCDVYEFSSTKGSAVKEITSYVIEIK